MSNNICGRSHLNTLSVEAIRREFNLIRDSLCYVSANFIPLPDETGQAGKFLSTNGSSLAWSVPAGGGSIGGSIANTQVAYGSGVNTIQGNSALMFDGTTLSMPNTSLSAYQVSLGSTILAQSLTLNNALFSDNMYFNGSSWTRKSTGFGSGLHLYNGQVMIHGVASGTGNFTESIMAKFNYDGTFALGTGIFTTPGNYTGATILLSGSTGTATIGGNLILGGFPTASELRVLEPSGSGTNYSAFKAQAQGANITYTLPAIVGAAGTVLTDVVGNGVLQWTAASAALSTDRIGFGSAGGILTSSANLGYSPTAQEFSAGFANIPNVYANQATGQYWLGALTAGNGLTMYVNDLSNFAYIDNTAHNSQVGINTATPDVALDVVGDFYGGKSTTYPNRGLIGTDIGTQKAWIGDFAGDTNATRVVADDANETVTITANSGSEFASGTVTIDNLVGTGIGVVKTDASGVLGRVDGTPVSTISNNRVTGQTAAVTLTSYTVGGSDESLLVSANVLVTTATLHSFSVRLDYTDEGGTSRTVSMNFSTLTGALSTAIANAGGAIPYEGVSLHIRAQAGTNVTLRTAGTFTTVVYNFEGIVNKIN